MNFIKKYFLNFSLSLDHIAFSLHCVPLGAYNTAYLARSCPRSTHILPISDKINKVSARHQIYRNVIRNSKNIFLDV